MARREVQSNEEEILLFWGCWFAQVLKAEFLDGISIMVGVNESLIVVGGLRWAMIDKALPILLSPFQRLDHPLWQPIDSM